MGQWRKTKLVARYSDHACLRDILVPLSAAPPSWAVVDQALSIAQREGGRVHGLHIVADESDLGNPAQETLRQEFGRRCAAAQVEGSFNLEVGVLSDKVRAMAALTDLVVIGLDAGRAHAQRGSDGVDALLHAAHSDRAAGRVRFSARAAGL